MLPLSPQPDQLCSSIVLVEQLERRLGLGVYGGTVRNREIGTGISEASKRVPIVPFDTQGGKPASPYFRQRNWVQAREAQIRLVSDEYE